MLRESKLLVQKFLQAVKPTGAIWIAIRSNLAQLSKAAQRLHDRRIPLATHEALRPPIPVQEATAQRSIGRHLAAIAVVAAAFVGTIGIMSATTELSGAVIASGSLVVESNVKKIQHPSGGVVAEILVADGSHVSTGDLLVRLDATEARANLAAITKTVWELTTRQARLETERDGGSEIAFRPDLLQAAVQPEIEHIVTGERRLFQLRREALAGQRAQLQERIAQLNAEIEGLSDQISAKGEEIELIQKELVGVRDLWTKNLVPIARLMALERDAARLKGERGQLLARVAESKGRISETKLQIIQLDQNMRSDVAKELADIRAKLSELVERRVTAAQELQRINICAPRSGFVHQLSVHTTGQVIGPGEQIMLIVPEADALIVEAKVTSRDIDQVRLGQQAVLRFTSFNQRRTPELNGSISRIAADASTDDHSGTSYYLVRIEIDNGEIARLRGLRLLPGMPVEAFIATLDRTILSYLLKPLSDQARRAFREQ